MRIDILTLFPEMFGGVLSAGVIGRASERGLLDFRVTNIRDHSTDKHLKADDYPFGGGAGQLMTAQPIFAALESLGIEPARRGAGTGGEEIIVAPAQREAGTKTGEIIIEPAQREAGAKTGEIIIEPAQREAGTPRLIYPSPRGRLLCKELAEALSREEALVLLCGHYEGVDQRALDAFGFEEISIGDYILTGGELAAMTLVDVVCRLVPGVLGSEASHDEESVYSGLLEYPQYTRPASFEGMDVPETLVSGDHMRIALWNFEQALRLTEERRPDMLRSWLAAHYDGLDKQRKKLAAPYREAYCSGD